MRGVGRVQDRSWEWDQYLSSLASSPAAIIVRRLDQRPIHLDDAPFLIFRIGSVASYQIVGLVGGEEFELGEAGVVRLEGRFGGLCLLGWLGGIVGCRS